jgi:hypothetical protein
MRCRRGFLLLLLSLLAASPLAASWNFLPAGQPIVNSIAADSSGQRILVSVDGAGVWQTENGGTDWLPISDRLSPDGGISASVMAVDAAADTLVASVGDRDRTWYRESVDGGQTWQPLTPGACGGLPLIMPRHHNIWFGTSGYHLYRSDDNGVTWSAIAELPAWSDNYRLTADPSRDSVLYAAAAVSRGRVLAPAIWKSTDLGVSWNVILRPETFPAYGNALLDGPVRLLSGYLAIVIQVGWEYPPRLFISPDEGVSWNEALTFSAIGVPPRQLFESLFYTGRLTVLTSTNILRSNDYGQSWNVICDSLPVGELGEPWMEQNPYSGDLYLKGTGGGAYISSDEGESWRVVHPSQLGLGAGRFTITGEAVFFQSSDYPLGQWQLESPYTEWKPVQVRSQWGDSLLFVGAVRHKQGNTLQAWGEMYFGIGTPLRQHRSQKASSCDNGLTWTLGAGIQDYAREVKLFTVFLRDSETWFASTSELSSSIIPRIFVSRNLGEYWDLISEVPDDGRIGSLVASDSTLYLVTSYGGTVGSAYRSNDGGASWQRMGFTGTLSSDVLVIMGRDVYAVDEGNTSLVRWQDGAWQVRSRLPLEVHTYTGWYLITVPADPPYLMMSNSTSDSLLISSDSGATWEYRDYQLPYPTQNTRLNNLTYDPYRHRIWISAGVGVCYLDASELNSRDHPLRFMPADFTILKAYPNPFNSQTRITYDLEKRGRVQLDLFNLQGQHVRSLTDAIQESGRHEMRFNGSGLSSGTYFVRLKSPSVTRTEKILLLK